MLRLYRLTALALAALIMLSAFACAEMDKCPQVEAGIEGILKYGNIVLDISGEALTDLGYAYGDIITADIGGHRLDMPVCPEYSDVETGTPVCRVTSPDSAGESYVILAINSDDLATSLGIAERSEIEEDPGYRWDYAGEYADGVPITLSLKEKGGYLDLLPLHQIGMSTVREAYPDLTDEQYANFRNVATTGMGAHVLYRSSSPVNPAYNRNREADNAVNASGIRTVLNLADDEASMKRYEDYANTYYSRLDVIPLNMVLDSESEAFQSGLAEGFRFLTAHEGPYLIHCNIGKDRAGFAAAVLEALMGASADEIVEDYLVSYYNFYGIDPHSADAESIAEGNICKTLATAFDLQTLKDADLAAAAYAYLQKTGLSDGEISDLKARLGTDIG